MYVYGKLFYPTVYACTFDIYYVYRNCYSWLRDVEKGQVDVDENVSAGIRLGIGTFNLVYRTYIHKYIPPIQ